jgi:hypothetical protein
MRKGVRIRLLRGKYCLFDETLDLESTPSEGDIKDFEGNIGEPFRIIAQMVTTPDYPEPTEDGWYICPSIKCGCMFAKNGECWYYFYEPMANGSRCTWDMLCETQADCIGRGLKKVSLNHA